MTIPLPAAQGVFLPHVPSTVMEDSAAKDGGFLARFVGIRGSFLFTRGVVGGNLTTFTRSSRGLVFALPLSVWGERRLSLVLANTLGIGTVSSASHEQDHVYTAPRGTQEAHGARARPRAAPRSRFLLVCFPGAQRRREVVARLSIASLQLS